MAFWKPIRTITSVQLRTDGPRYTKIPAFRMALTGILDRNDVIPNRVVDKLGGRSHLKLQH